MCLTDNKLGRDSESRVNTSAVMLTPRELVGQPQTSSSPPVIFIAARLRRLFCFGSLVILDVARCYLWLFTLYINIKIGKNSC